jgi:hypothetical protein
MSKLFVQVERAEDLHGRVDDYFTQPKQKPKPQTNADRIRAMTDEELAEAMLDCFAAFYDVEWSKQDILDWLKQEASE